VSCLAEEVIQGEKDRSCTPVRTGGRPMEKTATGSWSELINHFNVMVREAFTRSVV